MINRISTSWYGNEESIFIQFLQRIRFLSHRRNYLVKTSFAHFYIPIRIMNARTRGTVS